MAAGAEIELCCKDSKRTVPLIDFFTGPRETICKTHEVLTSISIPLPPPATGTAFEKFALRESNALAVASAASRLTLEWDKISSASIVLGAVAPTPLVAREASAHLTGKKPTKSLFKEAAERARQEAKPISDIRSTSWFRKELVQVLTLRTLITAFQRAKKTVDKDARSQ
jgi:carbon-monoxide dehydrogenase medium subunit